MKFFPRSLASKYQVNRRRDLFIGLSQKSTLLSDTTFDSQILYSTYLLLEHQLQIDRNCHLTRLAPCIRLQKQFNGYHVYWRGINFSLLSLLLGWLGFFLILSLLNFWFLLCFLCCCHGVRKCEFLDLYDRGHSLNYFFIAVNTCNGVKFFLYDLQQSFNVGVHFY